MRKNLLILILIISLAAFLRLYHLSSNPPSLYWDEASLGYNAYAIAQTAHDEHNEFLPVTRFIAFGDYKAPAYIYSDVPFVKAFGLTEFAVRLPSALGGILLVATAYFLSQEIFINSGKRVRIGLLVSFVLTISPWSLQLSRGAFEANLATGILSVGVLFLLKFVRRPNFRNTFLSVIFLALTIYSFNSHRIFVPLLIALVGLLNLREMWRMRKRVVIWILLFGIAILPTVPYFISRESRLRFQEVAWINDISPIVVSNGRIASDEQTAVSKILHNRRLIYAQEFLQHYSDNFKPDFLFFSGDPNPKLSIQKVGELNWIDLVPLIFGIGLLIKKRDKTSLFILGWYLLGVIPAATARETPHALRISPSLPMPQIIVGFGLATLVSLFNNKQAKIIAATLSVLFFLTVLFYNFYYWKWYPQSNSLQWQFGYKDMVAEVLKELPQYKGAIVTENFGRPYIYFLFYGGPISPEDYFENGKSDRDWFGLWTVHSIGNIYFGDYDKSDSGWLYVRPKGKSPANAKKIKTINDLHGDAVFEISAK